MPAKHSLRHSTLKLGILSSNILMPYVAGVNMFLLGSIAIQLGISSVVILPFCVIKGYYGADVCHGTISVPSS